MSSKKALNLAVPEKLLQQFNTVSAAYGHGKQKGMVLAAAMAMFLDAEPETQGEYLEQVMQTEIREGVDRMKDHAKAKGELEQATLAALRKASSQSAPPMRKAAKKKGKSKSAVKKRPGKK